MSHYTPAHLKWNTNRHLQSHSAGQALSQEIKNLELQSPILDLVHDLVHDLVQGLVHLTVLDTGQFARIIVGSHTGENLVGNRKVFITVHATILDFLQIVVPDLSVENLGALVSTQDFAGTVVDIDPLLPKNPLLHTQKTVAEGIVVTILLKNVDLVTIQKSIKMKIEKIVATRVVIKTTTPVAIQVATAVVILADIKVAIPA